MSSKAEEVRSRELELGWAVLVLIVNVILFASHAWALGSGLPSCKECHVAGGFEVSEVDARFR